VTAIVPLRAYQKYGLLTARQLQYNGASASIYGYNVSTSSDQIKYCENSTLSRAGIKKNSSLYLPGSALLKWRQDSNGK
jgi:hypothetical protein